MKRRARSRVSQRHRASFLSVLGIVLVFSLLVFFGASGFSGRAVEKQFGDITETIYGTCLDQPIQQYTGVPTALQEQSTAFDLGGDISELIALFANGDCQTTCYDAIYGNKPVQTIAGPATFMLNCNEEQAQDVLDSCVGACNSQSSLTGYAKPYDQEYQYDY